MSLAHMCDVFSFVCVTWHICICWCSRIPLPPHSLQQCHLAVRCTVLLQCFAVCCSLCLAKSLLSAVGNARTCRRCHPLCSCSSVTGACNGSGWPIRHLDDAHSLATLATRPPARALPPIHFHGSDPALRTMHPSILQGSQYKRTQPLKHSLLVERDTPPEPAVSVRAMVTL